jgi:hypothetical protein
MEQHAISVREENHEARVDQCANSLYGLDDQARLAITT